FAVGWLILALVVVGCYFLIDYKVATAYSYGRKTGEATPLADSWRHALSHFGDLCQFFLTILGGPMVRQFAIDPIPTADLKGWICLFGYVAAGIWALLQLKRGNSDTWAKALPWLALGGAVIAIAFGASIGRSTILAPARASVPRFISVSLHLQLAFLALVLLIWRQRRIKVAADWRLPWGHAVLGGLIALQIQPWLYGARLMEIWRASRLQAQAHVQFIEHFDPQPSDMLAYQTADVRRFAPLLDQLGYLDPPLVGTLRLDQFSLSDKPLTDSKGGIETAIQDDSSNEWNLAGYAILRDPSRPADALLVTAESPETPDPTIVGLGSFAGSQLPTRYRIDLQFSALDELNERDPGSWMRWTADLAPDTLPTERPLIIRTWAFDMTRRKAYELPQHFVLSADGTGQLLDSL
ncbi:MAG: hypothetical protein KDM63_18785, partial [Verrucomicrobiae bacterium]|nr:hypothetical protein [Verrucomicrobiae bacterium]